MQSFRQPAQWCALVVMLLLCSAPASASVSLLLEEPFGTFGAFNPTGHAAIYLSEVCAETPTRLRACRDGEMGVVISRYHRVRGYDWVAIPLIPYLYAVDDLSEVPDSATPETRARLRDAYRREHLMEIAPDDADGKAPRGEWIQLVGSAYDRRIFGFQLATTHDQDMMLIASLNDGTNRSHFNLFYRNCADFSRSVLRRLYPDSISRNSIADFGLTTPKHLARSVQHLGRARPELDYRYFQIPQVPGTISRSHHADGIAESLVRSKKYVVPLAFVSPTVAITLAAAYVGTGRFSTPKDAPIMPELMPVSNPITLEQDTISMDAAPPAQASPDFACSIPADTILPMTGGGSE